MCFNLVCGAGFNLVCAGAGGVGVLVAMWCSVRRIKLNPDVQANCSTCEVTAINKSQPVCHTQRHSAQGNEAHTPQLTPCSMRHESTVDRAAQCSSRSASK